MKNINAQLPLEVIAYLDPERQDEEREDFCNRLEEALEFDCDLDEVEFLGIENSRAKYSILVTAYLEIVEDSDDEEKLRYVMKEKTEELLEYLKKELESEVKLDKVSYRVNSFKNMDGYNTDVLARSYLSLMDDPDFFESLTALLFDSDEYEISSMHISSGIPYFEGTDDDGESFVLGVKISKNGKEEDMMEILDHAEEIYPRGNVFMLRLTDEETEDSQWEEITELDDEYSLYYRALNLSSIDMDSDAFYAADSIRLCIDDDYESPLEEEE